MDLTYIVNLLINSTIMASLLVILILFVKRIFKNLMSAKWHYIIWFILLIRLAVPYTVYSPINLSDLYKESKVESTLPDFGGEQQNPLESPRANPVKTSENPTNQSTTNLNSSVSINGNMAKSIMQGFTISNLIQGILSLINKINVDHMKVFMIWTLGVTILGLYAFAYNIFFWTKVKNGKVFTDQGIIQLLEECKGKIEVSINVSIIQTSEVSIPAIFGVTRPWLLMPERVLKGLEHENLRYVILHELSHMKRKDILINWIAFILQILYWFNPLIWIAFNRMRTDRELACDEAVLMRLDRGEGKKYGHTILDMVELVSGKVSYAGIAGILENKSQIKDRISMISQFGGRNSKLSVISIIIVMLLASSILVNAYGFNSAFIPDSVDSTTSEATATTMPAVPSEVATTTMPAASEPSTTTPTIPAATLESTATTASAAISEPIDIAEILSDSKAVSRMLNIKVGETINYSDVDPSIRGSVTKTGSNPSFQNESDAKNDVIELQSIVTDKPLGYGKESLVTFEYMYNVKSCENAVILVGFNQNDYRDDTFKALWAVPKGSGILAFKIPVTPKKWVETPFRVTAGMMDLASNNSLPVGYRVNLLPSDPERITIF